MKCSEVPDKTRTISSREDWTKDKRDESERLISKVEGVRSVSVLAGTNERPLDGIYILADPGTDPKTLVRTVQILLKNVLNLRIDYRIVGIRKYPYE